LFERGSVLRAKKGMSYVGWTCIRIERIEKVEQNFEGKKMKTFRRHGSRYSDNTETDFKRTPYTFVEQIYLTNAGTSRTIA
jgi:hypothetical protein